MKLLNPTQNKTALQQQQVKNILRTQEIEKAAAKARVNLASAEAEFNSVLAKNRAKWAMEEEEHAKRVGEMLAEVNSLEQRRKNALIPVKFLEEQAATKLKEAESYLAELKAKIAKTDVLTDLLEDKLDAAGKQLTDNQQKAAQLAVREDAVKTQAASVVNSSKLLSKKMLEFTNQQKLVYNDLDKRKTELFLMERSLIAKDENLKARESQLAQDRLRIKDERESLELAWQELRQKQK